MARILAWTKVGGKDMPREEWLAYRRTGIGGSDAATVMGMNAKSSLINLWADKTGRLPPKEDNGQMRLGRVLEPEVAKWFCEETGKRVQRRNAIFQHDTYDFILANVDREIIGENAGLECKTTTRFTPADFASGKIPPYYYCQCIHYMNVMGYDNMYIAIILRDSGDFYWFKIPYNKNDAEALLEMEVDFWNNHIIPDNRPEPDGSESAKVVLDKLFAERETNTVTLFEQEKTAAEFIRIQAEIKALESDSNRLKQALINALEKNTRGLTLNYEVSYLARARTGIDSKRLKSEFPEVYEKVKTETSYNVFGLKERKDV